MMAGGGGGHSGETTSCSYIIVNDYLLSHLQSST